MNSSFNKANVAGLVAAVTAMIMVLDKRLMWNLGPEFWGPGGVILTWLVTYFVPNADKGA